MITLMTQSETYGFKISQYFPDILCDFQCVFLT